MEGIGNLGSLRVHMVRKKGEMERGKVNGISEGKENGKGRVGKWTGKGDTKRQ